MGRRRPASDAAFPQQRVRRSVGPPWVPAIYNWREFALAGGLMSYGPSPNKGQCPLLALRGGYSCSTRPDGCAAIGSGCKLARLTARSVCTGVLRMAVAAHIRRICATAGLVIFLAASLGCPAGFAAEPKQVVLLHSFGRDFKPWSEYARAIRIELDRQSPWPLDITEHSLVTEGSDRKGGGVPCKPN